MTRGRGHLHVIGAGIAGLAAAVEAAAAGWSVTVHEAAPQAGGRCRSFHDHTLDRTIDNGTHLLLSANHAVQHFAARIGGLDGFDVLPAAFPFHDLETGDSWTVRPNAGRLPWWLLSRHRRVPLSTPFDYLALMRLAKAPSSATVADQLADNALYLRLIEPLCTAILNTEPEAASARLLGGVITETLARGGAACRPLLAREGLSAALVTPAVAHLRAVGGRLHTQARLERLEQRDGRITGLRFRDREHWLGPEEAVILAVSPSAAHALLPEDVPPFALRPIVNAHFRLPALPAPVPPMLGLVGGAAQWVFGRKDVLSVTVSAAGRWMETPAEEIAARLWRDVARALRLPDSPLPPWRIIKERRATLAHSPSQEILRPGVSSRFANLWLAGDWTATGLPCTLEGAVRSGHRAASLATATFMRV